LDVVGQVRTTLEQALQKHQMEASQRVPEGGNERETLWEYFHRTVFWDKRNNPVTPVIVFDQFEEIFTLGRNHPAAGLVLRQLADLVENYIPEAVRSTLERRGRPLGFDAAQQHYKVLIVLREDFVSRLDSIRAMMPSVMHNRFALGRMDGRKALR